MNQFHRTAAALLTLTTVVALGCGAALALTDRWWQAVACGVVVFVAINRITSIGDTVAADQIYGHRILTEGDTDEHPTFGMN